MARFNNVDFEIVPIVRPPPLASSSTSNATPPPAAPTNARGDATEIFTVDLSKINHQNDDNNLNNLEMNGVPNFNRPAAAAKICSTCADNVEKAKFLMNYLDQTDEVFHIKSQLEKERDQLNRLLEEKNTYIEALKKEEANLNFKLVKTLEDKDVHQKQLIDLHKKSEEVHRQKSAADIEAMSSKSSKDQLQHLVDELRHDKKYLQEKLDEKAKELTSIQVQRTTIENKNDQLSLKSKEMKRLSACLKKCFKISKKIKRYERKGQNRIPIKKFSKYLKKLNESAKFLSSIGGDFSETFSSSSSSSESESDESLNISREAPSTSIEKAILPQEKLKKRRSPLKKTPAPPPTATPQTAAARKLQNAWQSAISAPPLAYKKPKEALLKKDVAKIFVREKNAAVVVVDVVVSWSEMKGKIFLEPKLSPIKEKIAEKIVAKKAEIDAESDLDVEPNLTVVENPEQIDENTKIAAKKTKINDESDLDVEQNSIVAENLRQLDENTKIAAEKAKINDEADLDIVQNLTVVENLEKIYGNTKNATEKDKINDESDLDVEKNLTVVENPEQFDENTETLVVVNQNQAEQIHIDNQFCFQETQPNTSFELEDNLMIVDESEAQNTASVENLQPPVDKLAEVEKTEKIKLPIKRKKSPLENDEKSTIFRPTTSKKAKISANLNENLVEKGLPTCCREPIADKKCPSRIRQHFLSVLDTLLSKDLLINLGRPKKSGGTKNLSSSTPDTIPQDRQSILRAFKNLQDKMDKLTPEILVKCLLENCLQKCSCSLIGHNRQWKKSGIFHRRMEGEENFDGQNAPYLSWNEKKIFELLDMLFQARSFWLKPTCDLMIEQLKLKIFNQKTNQNQQIFETYCRWLFYFARKIGNFQILGLFFYELLFFPVDDFRQQQDLTSAFLSLASVWPPAFLRCVFGEEVEGFCDKKMSDSEKEETFFFEIFRHFLFKKSSTNKDATIITKAKNLLQHFCPESSTLKNEEKCRHLFDSEFFQARNSNLIEYFERNLKRILKSVNPYLVMGFELEEYVNLNQNIDSDSNDIYDGLIFSQNFLQILTNLCKFCAICDQKFVEENLLEPFLKNDSEFCGENLDRKINRFIISLLILGQLYKIPKFGLFFQSRDQDLCDLIRSAQTSSPHQKTPILQYVVYASSLQYAPVCCKVKKIVDDFFSVVDHFTQNSTPQWRFLRLFYEKLLSIVKCKL